MFCTVSKGKKFTSLSCILNPSPGDLEGFVMSLYSCNFSLALMTGVSSVPEISGFLQCVRSPPKNQHHYETGQSKFLQLYLLHILTQPLQYIKTQKSGNAHKHVTKKSFRTWPWTWCTISFVIQKVSLLWC